jgi:hypothetical protein
VVKGKHLHIAQDSFFPSLVLNLLGKVFQRSHGRELFVFYVLVQLLKQCQQPKTCRKDRALTQLLQGVLSYPARLLCMSILQSSVKRRKVYTAKNIS